MRSLAWSAPASAFALAAFAVACGKAAVTPRRAAGVSEVASITVTSPTFSSHGAIPVDYSCDGKGARPELVLSSPPPGTKSLVVIIDDPDAPDGTYTHMVAFDLSPDLRKLRGGAGLEGAGPAARFGLNDADSAGYTGPCPPRGELHRYRFHVLALDTMLKLPEGATLGQVDAAMDGHVLGEGALVGEFGH